MPGESDELSGIESAVLARSIREEIARRRISRQKLADEARISLSTLEKALSGARPFTLATLVRIEEALGLSLRHAAATSPVSDHAPAELGAYSREAVSWLPGTYLTLRPSFGDAQAIYAYRIRVKWSEEAGHLVFEEEDRTDTPFTQSGPVSVPHQSGHIYLVTNRHGQYRLIVVGRPRIEGELYGLLTTLKPGQGTSLTPISVPIALVPEQDGATSALGRIHPGDPSFTAYRDHIDRILRDGYALLPPAQI